MRRVARQHNREQVRRNVAMVWPGGAATSCMPFGRLESLRRERHTNAAGAHPGALAHLSLGREAVPCSHDAFENLVLSRWAISL